MRVKAKRLNQLRNSIVGPTLSMYDIIDSITKRTGFQENDVKTIINQFEVIIYEALSLGYSVNILGLGSIYFIFEEPKKKISGNFEKLVFGMPVGTEYMTRTKYKIKFITRLGFLNTLTETAYATIKAGVRPIKFLGGCFDTRTRKKEEAEETRGKTIYGRVEKLLIERGFDCELRNGLKEYSDLLREEGDFFTLNAPNRSKEGYDTDFKDATSMDEVRRDMKESVMSSGTGEKDASKE